MGPFLQVGLKSRARPAIMTMEASISSVLLPNTSHRVELVARLDIRRFGGPSSPHRSRRPTGTMPHGALDAHPVRIHASDPGRIAGTTFESDKARALLAYLAIESRQPLSRETLAGLLWPEQPESRARHSLRQALYNLRRALKDQKVQPGVLSSTRDTIQFNRDSDCWLDVEAFDRLVGARTSGEPTSHLLSEAVELYRGSLLEGFSLDDSVPFEEWLLVRREQYRRQVLDALHQLTTAHMERAEYDEALRYAWRLVDADPWREEAQRQVMWLLALTGQRAAALAQFETCRQMLREEFGVEPGAETVALYTIIRDGKIEPAPPARHASPPAFLAPEDKRAEPQPALLVAREAELDALERFLNMAQAGEGRVALVTGGPGSGKTMLIRHFVEQAMARHQELLVTFGNGNAYTGTGDPYHPFIETLKMLSGDVESRWAGGTVSRDHRSACGLRCRPPAAPCSMKAPTSSAALSPATPSSNAAALTPTLMHHGWANCAPSCR